MERPPITFHNAVTFRDVTFDSSAHFYAADFHSRVDFSHATFANDAYFANAIFRGTATFDSAHFHGTSHFEDASFLGTTTFSNAIFDSSLYFDNADFYEGAYFNRAMFRATADYVATTFQDVAYFSMSEFKDGIIFSYVEIYGLTSFDDAKISGEANFSYTRFSRSARFPGVIFGGKTNFSNINFGSNAVFRGTSFKGETDFSSSVFHGIAKLDDAKFLGTIQFGRALSRTISENRDYFDRTIPEGADYFARATFDTTADFSGSIFQRAVFFSANFAHSARFTHTIFMDTTDFMEVEHSNAIEFDSNEISGIMFLGSDPQLKVDLTFAKFSDDTEIRLIYPVDLIMPLHKIDKVGLVKTLGYTRKKLIIDDLKKKIYEKDNKADLAAASFELDYILAKSTMYQVGLDGYQQSSWYHLWYWPEWLFNTVYYWTMGFGYRPFRLIWWAAGIAVIGTFVFYRTMGRRVNAYIAENFDRATDTNSESEIPLGIFETLLNCGYFSVMLLFTFRMKGNLLTFFKASEKKLITIQWALGIALYITFLLHTSSVLQNLKSLFDRN